MSPIPHDNSIVFSSPPSFFIISFVSFIIFVRYAAFVDSDLFIPASIPDPIANIFFSVPQSSSPNISFVVSIFTYFSLNISIFFGASVNDIGSFFITSFAKLGPDSIDIFSVFIISFTISYGNLLLYIPFDVIIIGVSLILSFILLSSCSIIFVGSASIVKSYCSSI